MKKLFFLLLVLPALFQACMKDKILETSVILEPVYKSKSEVYANIKSNAPRAIQNPGKIFLYGNYIFLNEIDKGIHVIDNSNPGSPVMKAFIDIPGNLDIAVKGNILYADLYRDMVVIDISNPMQANFVKYISNVFPQREYSNGFVADTGRVIVDWIKRDTTVRMHYSHQYVLYNGGGPAANGGGPVFYGGGAVLSAGGPSIPGIAGSMARFSLVNNFLYAVNKNSLLSFDITNTTNPLKVSTKIFGWNVETIYPFKDKLFIGSQSGMFIFDIANPANPSQLGQFMHATACDPVIADSNFAFITLHSGTPCRGISDQLDVVNVSNLFYPMFVRTYPLTNPQGLAKDQNLLFVCDGKAGLKLYNATDPSNLVLKKQIGGMETYDAIAWNKNLIVVAKDGLYQFDYTNPDNLVQRSKLTVNR